MSLGICEKVPFLQFSLEITTGLLTVTFISVQHTGEVPFLRIWQFSSLVSVFINLTMVYGALVVSN
jgi:hypothetical protein